MKTVKTISILLIPTLIFTGLTAVSIPSLVYGNGGGKTISGSSEAVCTRAAPDIAERFVDLDLDASNDLRIRTRLFICEWTGLLEGTSTLYQTYTNDLRTNIARATTTVTFWGTVGDSEPGTMTAISTQISDLSDPARITNQARLVVVNGLGGLQGICGGGTSEAVTIPPGPTVSTTNYEFRFGEACNSAKP